MAEKSTLTDKELHCHVLPLSQEVKTSAWRASLSTSEIATAESYRHMESRATYIQSRVVLRELLAGYLGCKATEVEIVIGDKGKPHVAGPIHFNIAHTSGRALFAFALRGQVGADVEAIRPSNDWSQIARRFFCPEEAAELASFPPRDRDAAFFRCWTRKEAFIKATGEGLSMPLDSFRVSMTQKSAQFLKLPGEAGQWKLYDIDAGPGFAAALAHPGAELDLRLFKAEVPEWLRMSR